MTATDILDGKARIGGSEYDSPGLEERELRLRMAKNFDCTPLLFSFLFPSLSFVRINRMTQHRLSPFPNDVHLEED